MSCLDIAKSNFSIEEREIPWESCCEWKFPDRKIEEPFSSSGQGRSKDPVSGRAWRYTLASSGIRAQERVFSFYSREGKDSPCHQGEGIGNHPTQRKGKTQEEGVGKCRIQKWRGKCVIYKPDLKTWRHHKDAQLALGILVILKVKLKLNVKKKLQPRMQQMNI